MKSIDHLIYFKDECPRVGSGWRKVQVKLGRKWVYISSIDGKNKISMKNWDRLENTMKRYHLKNGESNLNTFMKEK